MLALALGLLAACSQQTGIRADRSPQTPPGAPFAASTDEGDPAPSAYGKPSGLPAGTLIIVRLRSTLSSATAHAGDDFSAVVDEPIIRFGEMLVPLGAVVKGKVVDASPSGDHPGYLRLVLTEISFQGKSFPLQTASVFLKGSGVWEAPSALDASATASGASNERASRAKLSPLGLRGEFNRGSSDIEFSNRQRLTFRLAGFFPI